MNSRSIVQKSKIYEKKLAASLGGKQDRAKYDRSTSKKSNKPSVKDARHLGLALREKSTLSPHERVRTIEELETHIEIQSKMDYINSVFNELGDEDSVTRLAEKKQSKSKPKSRTPGQRSKKPVSGKRKSNQGPAQRESTYADNLDHFEQAEQVIKMRQEAPQTSSMIPGQSFARSSRKKLKSRETKIPSMNEKNNEEPELGEHEVHNNSQSKQRCREDSANDKNNEIRCSNTTHHRVGRITKETCK